MFFFSSVFAIGTYLDGVVFTRFRADRDDTADGQFGPIVFLHKLIYLFQTFFIQWHHFDISRHIQF